VHRTKSSLASGGNAIKMNGFFGRAQCRCTKFRAQKVKPKYIDGALRQTRYCHSDNRPQIPFIEDGATSLIERLDQTKWIVARMNG